VYLGTSNLLEPILARVRPKLRSSIEEQLNPGGSLFLSPHLSVADFCGQLHEREIECVLLPRFFGQAEVELLIADDELDRIDDLVTKWPGGQSVKLYSVTGGRREHRFEPPDLRPSAHYAVSLFPPHLAETLIASAQCDSRGAKMLDARDTFLACAYRAAYLERECWVDGGSDCAASEQCETQLRRFAGEAGVALDGSITPGALHDLLDRNGWRPSLDLLERAAHWMPWIRDILPEHDREPAGVTLFFIRQRAVEAGWQPKILDCIRGNGFELLSVVDLGEEQVRTASVEFRGGNWGRGPYRVSGGPPAAICIALDLLPVIVDDRHSAQFPDSDNSRIFDAKYAARDLVNAGVAKPEHYNPLHSADNAAQAWRAVRLLIPEREVELRRTVDRLRREFATADVIHDFTKHGRRAKVELVEFDGKLAIRKTFRPSALQFMQREAEVMERLSPLCPEIPRLLDSGPNYLVIEHVGGGATPPRKRSPDHPPKPLPLRHVRKLAELITTSMANGFDPIDLRADGNVIYTPSGLHLIDFEFWRPCEPAPPERSMCLSGIPAGDKGEQPLAARRNRDPYRIGWYPYTLLSVESFLYDPPMVQRVKRTANFVRAYGSWASRTSLSLAKRAFRRAGRKAASVAVRLFAPRARRLAVQ
jgi:hypothetical protein